MANYRNISINFWADSKVDDEFTPEDKYFYLYLLTNPHTNICGCYEISMKQMERETGYNTDTVKRLIKRMQESHNVIRYCSETKEVLILNWYKYNWSKSDNVKKAVVGVTNHIKNDSFKKYVIDRVYIWYGYHIEPSVTDTVTDTVTVTVTDTVTETDTENRYNIIDESSMECDSFESQHNEKKHTSVDYEAEFEKLWSLYPCKRGKSQVSKKAKKELAKAGFEVVSKAIENYKKEVEDIRQNSFNQQWLNGSTFFNGRWKDYVTANEPTFPDGRREVEYEDGSKIIYFPNGKVLDVDPYGLSHELLPHEIEELKEGRYK
jgi:hypothetical protein